MFVVITGRLFNDNRPEGGLLVYGDNYGQPFLTWADAKAFVEREVQIGDYYSVQNILKS